MHYDEIVELVSITMEKILPLRLRHFTLEIKSLFISGL